MDDLLKHKKREMPSSSIVREVGFITQYIDQWVMS